MLTGGRAAGAEGWAGPGRAADGRVRGRPGGQWAWGALCQACVWGVPPAPRERLLLAASSSQVGSTSFALPPPKPAVLRLRPSSPAARSVLRPLADAAEHGALEVQRAAACCEAGRSDDVGTFTLPQSVTRPWTLELSPRRGDRD